MLTFVPQTQIPEILAGKELSMWKAAFFILLLSLYTELIRHLVVTGRILRESEPTFMVGGVLVIGYALLKVLQSRLMKSLEGHVDRDRILTLRYFLDVGYFLVWGVVLVTFLGAGFKNLVLGGALLSALAGIVAQGSLSNLFAGIVLALTHPFRVGETISFLTWQYPRLAASLAHGTQNPEHRGTVLAIGKIYTTIAAEDGREMYVPNNIMLQAMILREAPPQGERPVTFTAEVDLSVDPARLRERVEQALSTDRRIISPVEILVRSMAPRSMTLEFRALWQGESPSDFSRLIVDSLRTETLPSTST